MRLDAYMRSVKKIKNKKVKKVHMEQEMPILTSTVACEMVV